ncbi:MAG: hypothetical protein ORN51_08670 [Akkermansiaceae bacterium]|nr:hypothetical protein [Akkermansiaceae bacterium]
MRILTICFSLLFQTILHAQDGTKVDCRFLSLDTQNEVPKMLVLSGKDAQASLTVPTGSISEKMTCFSLTDTFTFVSAADQKPIATAKISPNIKAAILVFVPGPSASDKPTWRIFVVEDSAKNFPDGGAFVANFHSQDIRFVIGETKLILHPGATYGVPIPTKRDSFNMAPVAFQFQQDGAWVGASETMLRFLPKTNYLMFTFMDKSSGRPRVVTFQDSKFAVAE